MDDSALQSHSEPDAVRSEYFERISELNVAPLWLKLARLVPKQPLTAAVPTHWAYDRVLRPVLMEAGRLITAEEAERRVLMLENGGLKGQSCATNSLYAGLQLVMPGEVAPAHRHTQTAIRFIVEGAGAYTTVAGERTELYPGDFVITPSWTFHDHGNDTDLPMVWLDVLDIPLMSFLGAGFFEPANAKSQSVSRPLGDSQARYANNLAPVDWRPVNQTSPITNYPYARSRETLDFLAKTSDPDACHGYKMRYVNPATGGHVMPTVGAFIQFLPKDLQTANYRCTDGTIYCVVEGEGESRIGDQVIRWKPRDVFAVPSWAQQSHRASSDAVLFSASDRPVHEKLDLWREERSPTA